MTGHPLEQAIVDLFTEILAYHETHVKPFRELAQAAGAKLDHVEELELAWERVTRTRQNLLLAAQGVPIRSGKPPRWTDYPAETSQAAVAPLTVEHLARFTGAQLRDAVEACRASLNDCRRALRSLEARDGSGPADYWLGDGSPTSLFRSLAEWFEAALKAFRALRQRRALEEHREAGQFKSLDEASPTVLVQVKVPAELRDRVDAAAEAAGVTRSEWIRQALEDALGEAESL